MARLPQPGGDQGTWGQVLNEFLLQSHKADGTLGAGVVTSNNLAPGAVDQSSIANGTVTSAALAASGGSQGQVLTRDTSQPGGLGWTNPSASSATTIDTDATLGANSDTAVASQRATRSYVTASVTTHAQQTDPHANAKYAIMPNGGRRIWTQAAAPTAADGAVDGDIWLGPEV